MLQQLRAALSLLPLQHCPQMPVSPVGTFGLLLPIRALETTLSHNIVGTQLSNIATTVMEGSAGGCD